MLDMTDDIDIEEHDIFDNPLVRKIFPDITKLKKEIEEPIILDEQEENIITKLAVEKSQSLDLDVKEPDYSHATETFSNCTKFFTLGKEPLQAVLSNESVIGSIDTILLKHSKVNAENNLLASLSEPKIILEDIKVFIEKKETFCKICMILFSTKHKFSMHRKTVHDTVVYHNINNSRYRKRKTKAYNVDFSSQNSYKRVCKKSQINNHKVDSKQDVIIDLETSIDILDCDAREKRPRCIHCSEIFLDQKSLIDHLYNVLAAGDIKSTKKNVYQKKCNLVTKSIAKKKVIINLVDDETSKDNDRMSVDGNCDQIADNCQSFQRNSECNNEDIYNERIISSNEKNNYETQYEVMSTEDSNTLFSCEICSYYIKDKQSYLAHLANNHSGGTEFVIKPVFFNPYCKFCSVRLSGFNIYNKHLRKHHLKEYTRIHTLSNHVFINNKFSKDNNLEVNSSRTLQSDRNHQDLYTNLNLITEKFALKTILYKCCVCDIHFFCINDAIRHIDHMELVDWRCFICQLLFKKEGEFLHMKQHGVSSTINIIDINENNINKYLYNCIKCAIYFEESHYKYHYLSCESTLSDSEYCKICDILIDTKSIEHHKLLHKHEKIKSTDFIYISSADILDDNLQTEAKTNMQKIEYATCVDDLIRKGVKLVLYYCEFCKSYFSDFANNQETHLKARCSTIVKHTCIHCGLVLTEESFIIHKRMHKMKRYLVLIDFTIFDLNGTQMNPPIPEYPQCYICRVHFLTKNAVENHLCNDVEFMTCRDCDLKLSHRAYKLHISFHEYTFKNKHITNTKRILGQDNEDSKKIYPTNRSWQMVEHVSSNKKILIFSCKNCSLSLYDYDKVVEHCQDHNIQNMVNNTLKICNRCSLKFTEDLFDVHSNHCSLSKCVFDILLFNTYYFRAENKVWLKHTFKSLSREKVRNIISGSIYEFEHRVKMTVIQPGQTNITVYKCSQCRSFTDPLSIKAHIEDNCKKGTHQYPCSICGLSFDSFFSQENHEKIHESQDISLKALRIVTFNKYEDIIYNQFILSSELHILYQCRNCNVVVKKIHREIHNCHNDNIKHCNKCGLLFGKDNYSEHLEHHANLPNFNDGFMKVVLFGKKNHAANINKHLISSYVGIQCDYYLFQCIHCDKCFETQQTIANHVYLSASFKCSACHIYFSSPNILHEHSERHKKDPEFVIKNINLIQLKIYKCRKNNNLSLDSGEDADKVAINNKSCAKNDQNNETEIVKIYKCTCGLHFINKAAAIKHFDNCNSKSKRSKQHCLKCNLLFATNELFDHLIDHHSNKDNLFNYKIETLYKV